MTEQQWPEGARAAVVSALVEKDATSGRNLTAGYWSQYADAVLAALAEYADLGDGESDTEWGVRWASEEPTEDAQSVSGEAIVRSSAQKYGGKVCRRRYTTFIGPWEVAPDA